MWGVRRQKHSAPFQLGKPNYAEMNHSQPLMHPNVMVLLFFLFSAWRTVCVRLTRYLRYYWLTAV
ncbi:hypothetical protein BDZ91DRAFT_725024 [Kalaharituber pfeilii]|nr:hypothetical protein BDZ91DRAFT_725024 [Kalaharituber pfeilii]